MKTKKEKDLLDNVFTKLMKLASETYDEKAIDKLYNLSIFASNGKINNLQIAVALTHIAKTMKLPNDYVWYYLGEENE